MASPNGGRKLPPVPLAPGCLAHADPLHGRLRDRLAARRGPHVEAVPAAGGDHDGGLEPTVFHARVEPPPLPRLTLRSDAVF
jgi:hypothetical protein